MTMNVASATSVSGSAAATSSTTGAASSMNSLSPNDFLTMLIAEMQNQDPTKPMDPAQMVSQLATVSQVSQSVKTNETLSSLLTATSLAQAEQLIGKTIVSADGSVSGKVASVNVAAGGATATLAGGQQIALGAGVTISAQ
jgi:flagellar basal-body rod modification protein FlgD